MRKLGLYDLYVRMKFQHIANLVISYNDYNKPWKIQSKFQTWVPVNNRSVKVILIDDYSCSILSVLI